MSYNDINFLSEREKVLLDSYDKNKKWTEEEQREWKLVAHSCLKYYNKFEDKKKIIDILAKSVVFMDRKMAIRYIFCLLSSDHLEDLRSILEFLAYGKRNLIKEIARDSRRAIKTETRRLEVAEYLLRKDI